MDNEQKDSPYLKANCLSKMFFWWLSPMLRKGFKKELEFEDLYKVTPQNRSSILGSQLADLWDEEVASTYMKNEKLRYKYRNPRSKNYGIKKEKTPSLGRVFRRQFGWYFAFLGSIAFFEDIVLKILQPLLLGQIIRFFNHRGSVPEWHGILYATALIVVTFLYTVFYHPLYFGVQYLGMRMRIAAGSLIYRKSLRLSQNSLSTTTIGNLVNLISNDINRFDMTATTLHHLWIGPLQTLIVLYILWYYFGPSCLVGLGFLILLIPIQIVIVNVLTNLREVANDLTDSRLRLMNEIIGGIRVIKMYAWEVPFTDLVRRSRLDELKIIKRISYLRALNTSLLYTATKNIVFLTLLTYVLTNHKLTSEKVFVTLALYNNVKTSMTSFFPGALANLAETMVSIHRLEKFLMMEERDVKSVKNEPPPGLFGGDDSNRKIGVWIDHVTATWGKNTENCLTDITLKCELGELLGVIGQVGSGKGSLLLAILGELPPKEGKVFVRGKIGYASQEPVVFGISVIDNILFGREYEPFWYEKVCNACALARDFEKLPYGDRTLCGEKGSALSGGQKARVNLARAVYARADIYLLDDPLSAVDSEVGRHLVDECINGILRNKARILVTHQIQFLKKTPHIIVLNRGEIQAEGNWESLDKRNDVDLDELMKSETDILLPVEVGAKESSQVVKKRISAMNETLHGKPSPSDQIVIQRQPAMAFNTGETVSRNLIIYEEVFEPSMNQDDNVKQLNLMQLTSKLSQINQIPELRPETPKGTEKKKEKGIPKLIEEARSKGTVTVKIYWIYLASGTSCFLLTLMIFFQILTQALFTGSDYWLNFWTEAEEKAFPNGSIDQHYNHKDAYEVLKHDRKIQLIVYSVIISALLIACIIRTFWFFVIAMKSSANLHNQMFSGLIRSPMRFFDLNPIGRIMNRIAKDINQIDDLIPVTYFEVIEIYLCTLGIVFLVALVNPYLLIPAAILSVFLYACRRYYVRSSRALKRLESISKSPLLTHLSATLNGLVTIRSFNVEEEFTRQFDDLQDIHTSAFYPFIATSRWLGIRLDWISVIFITVVTYSFFLFERDGPEVGLGLSAVIQLTGICQWGIRQSTDLENQMVSVERVLEYTKLEPEAPLDSIPGHIPPPNWPSKGEIAFYEVTLSYGADEPPILSGLSFRVKPSEKIGIIGRTGAGKSSLITALFRIAEPEGRIEIDGVDIGLIGLHDLRSKISIIPQEPVLFSGSLRMNLDPFGASTDDEIWNVLEDIHLLSEIKRFAAGLNFEVAEGGSNFSVGQRQLICLGRAILKKNKILVLDEATANVDQETDTFIQKTIRVKFQNCTVLTVAHRLNTVIDCDRILVLDAGKVKEFDEPYNLLQSKYSALSDFVEQTGPENAKLLRKMAAAAREKRKVSLTLYPKTTDDESSLSNEGRPDGTDKK